VLRDVLAIAGTGQFLPYDKDRRWGGEEDESIMDGIEVQADDVLIPTLNRRTNTVTVHLYGQPTQALDSAHALSSAAGTSRTA
jgi:hypothetical protein